MLFVSLDLHRAGYTFRDVISCQPKTIQVIFFLVYFGLRKGCESTRRDHLYMIGRIVLILSTVQVILPHLKWIHNLNRNYFVEFACYWYSKPKLQASEVVNLLCDKLFLPFSYSFCWLHLVFYSNNANINVVWLRWSDRTDSFNMTWPEA